MLFPLLLILLPYVSPQTYFADNIDPTISPVTNVWQVVNDSATPFLTSHSVVGVDSTGLLIAYGGQYSETAYGSPSVNEDIYVYNTGLISPGWTHIDYDLTLDNSTAPVGRWDHTAVLYGDYMWVFGGRSNADIYNQLWKLDLSDYNFTQVDSSGWSAAATPLPVYGHTAHVSGTKMYVFGGYELVGTDNFQLSNSLYAYSFEDNTWEKINPTGSKPAARAHHSSALYTNSTKIVPNAYDSICTPSPCFMIYGGDRDLTGGTYDDMWVYSLNTMNWHPIYYQTGPQPLVSIAGTVARTSAEVPVAGRTEHQCVIVQQRMLCVGGYAFAGFDDLAEYDPVFNRWLLPDYSNTLPAGFQGHQMVLINDVVYIFGGVQAATRNFVELPLYYSAHTRPLCKSGWAAPDGNWMCWPCADGYAAFFGSTACEQCPPGFYTSVGQDDCIPCPAGYFNANYGGASLAACQACPPGTYFETPGCPFENCYQCGGGEYDERYASTKCRQCPAGTARPAPGVNDTDWAVDISYCIPCLDGEFSTVAATVCLPCPPGFSSKSGDAFCRACPLGHYSAGATGECTPCPKGTFSTAFATEARYGSSCQLCPAGTFNDQDGQSICTPCARGEYQDETGQQSCKACEAGTYGNREGLSTKQCYDCPAGQYNPDEGQSSCQLCPAATFSTATGATTAGVCIACPEGTYSAATGNAESDDCIPCPKGHWGGHIIVDQGLTQCFQCPPGTYQPEEGANSDSLCLPCPAMTYSGAGAEGCTACPYNSYAHGGWRECVWCNSTTGEQEGWIQNGHFDLFWTTHNNSDINKWQPQAGSELARTGAGSTDMYGTARFRPDDEYSSGATGKLTSGFLRFPLGSNGVNGALHGYEQTVYPDTYNRPIIKGSVWTRAANLSPFPGRTPVYQAIFTFYTDNSTTVKTIDFTPPGGNPGLDAWVFGDVSYQPDGHLMKVKVELVVENCLASGRVDWDDVTLHALHDEVCQCIDTPGTYFDRDQIDAITEINCIWCLPSYACRAGMQFKCAAHEMSHGQSNECMDCLPGWKCDIDGASPCTYLTYLDPLTQDCNPCTAGHECGELTLTPCWPGTYGHGDYECVQCMPGSYSNISGAQFCYNCEPGTSANHMRTGCFNCPLNHYSPDGLECILCEVGTYTPGMGYEACQPCSNITESVSITIGRNTFDTHINLVPDYCAGQVTFELLGSTDLTTPLGTLSTGSSDGRSLTYRANAGAVGMHQFEAQVRDAISQTTQDITATVNIINSIPEAVPDFLSIENMALVASLEPLINDIDADGDELFIHSVFWDGPDDNITFDITSNQVLTVYFPDNFVGNNDNLRYYINDSLAVSLLPASIPLCRQCSTPVAMADAFSVPQGTVYIMDVLANDVDADGDMLSITSVGTSTQGVIPTHDALNITYSAPQGYCGLDVFTYEASTLDGTSTGNVQVTITDCLCSQELDIVILMDAGSTTTDNDFLAQRQFISNLKSRLNLNGESGPKIGIVVYGFGAAVRMRLTGVEDTINTWLESATLNTSSVDGDLSTAMSTAQVHFTDDGRGTGFPRRLIIITNGFSAGPIDEVVMANSLKSDIYPVAIYAVVVGSATSNTITSVASEATSDYIYNPFSFAQLDSAVIPLVDHMCDQSKTV